MERRITATTYDPALEGRYFDGMPTSDLTRRPDTQRQAAAALRQRLAARALARSVEQDAIETNVHRPLALRVGEIAVMDAMTGLGNGVDDVAHRLFHDGAARPPHVPAHVQQAEYALAA